MQPIFKNDGIVVPGVLIRIQKRYARSTCCGEIVDKLRGIRIVVKLLRVLSNKRVKTSGIVIKCFAAFSGGSNGFCPKIHVEILFFNAPRPQAINKYAVTIRRFRSFIGAFDLDIYSLPSSDNFTFMPNGLYPFML